jgi:hypothetical protein
LEEQAIQDCIFRAPQASRAFCISAVEQAFFRTDTLKNVPSEITSFELSRPPEFEEIELLRKPLYAPRKAAMLRLFFVVFVHKNCETAPSKITSFELPRPPEPSEAALPRKLLFVVMTTLVEITTFQLPRPPDPYEVALWCAVLVCVMNFVLSENILKNINIMKLA